MERGVIERDPRDTVRSIRGAMHGSVIRALVELLTNSDDSYIRFEEEDIPHKGIIEIEFVKEGYKGNFAVRDQAEGMSLEDIRTNFKKYGKSTSGFKSGKRVRGYFGHGAKDALASMIDGRICSIQDGQFVECKLYIDNDKPMYEILDPLPVTAKIRKEHSIPNNGTVAYFQADPQITGNVPQLQTVQEQLANNFLLRKIMTNPKRAVFLKSGDVVKRTLRYQYPKGREIYSKDHSISFSDYEDFPIHISILRSDTELLQTGDDRQGGLLLVDEDDVVLVISLFKYDNEPLASRFFGEVRIGNFRELLINEEPVLREDRFGLNERHGFTSLLISEIENILEEQVKIERLRKQKKERTKIDKEENARFKQAFSILNDIAKTEIQEAINLGEDPSDEIEEPPNGFCIYPSYAEITVGKRYILKLLISSSLLINGSEVIVESSNPKIRVITPNIELSSGNGVGIIKKYITVSGSEANIEGEVKASLNENISKSKVYVKPEEDLYFEGMIFQPGSLTLRPNSPRKLSLLVYTKMINSGSEIFVSTDNDSINLSQNIISVNESNAVRHVAKHTIEVWGEGEGQYALVQAEYGPYLALAEVNIRSKSKKEDIGRKGMFREPEFNFDPSPLQRTSYSSETGKVEVYVNFPSIKSYLGENRKYGKTILSQVLVADLVAERCFYEIARKKVETSGALINPAGKHDAIQRDANELSRKFGDKLHKALVDQKLVEEAKSLIVDNQ